MMRNSTLGPFVPPPFTAPPSIITVNVLFFSSLGVILVAAFIAILVRSWIRELDRGLEAISDSKRRALVREYRNQGLLFWKLPQVIALLPILIYISLLLFSSGLVIFLLHIHKPSGMVAFAVFLCGAIFYVVTTTIATLDSSAPFRSPISRALGLAYRRAYAFLPCESWRRTIATSFSDHYPLQRLINLIRRVIWWRPYSEGYITGSSRCDRANHTELQLSTAVLNWLFKHDRRTEVHYSLFMESESTVYRATPGHWAKIFRRVIPQFSELTLEEARCIATSLCSRGLFIFSHRATYSQWASMAAGVLAESPQPWDHLISSLMMVRADRDGYEPSVVAQETNALSAIQAKRLTQEQTYLVIDSLILAWRDLYRTKIPRVSTTHAQERAAIVRILAALLFGRQVNRFTNNRDSYDEYAIVDTMVNALVILCQNTGEDHYAFRTSDFYRRDELFAPCHHDMRYQELHYLRKPSVLESVFSEMRRETPSHTLPPEYREFGLSFLFFLQDSGRHLPHASCIRSIVHNEMLNWIYSLTTYTAGQTWDGDIKVSLTLGLILLRGSLMDHASGGNNSQSLASAFFSEYDGHLSRTDTQVDHKVLELISVRRMNQVPAVERWRCWSEASNLVDPWLALHAANVTLQQAQLKSLRTLKWSDNPAFDVIAHDRMDLYDLCTVEVEAPLVQLFLSSSSFSVVRRAFGYHIKSLLTSTASLSTHQTAWAAYDPTLENSIPATFNPDLTAAELSAGWCLLKDQIMNSWNDLPGPWRQAFSSEFLKLRAPTNTVASKESMDPPDEGTSSGALHSVRLDSWGGLDWMETLWRQVMDPSLRQVRIERVEQPWDGLMGVCKGIYPEQTRSVKEAQSGEVLKLDIDRESSKSGAPEHAIKQILDVLGTLLEAAPRSTLSAELVERLRASCLVGEGHTKASDTAEHIEKLLNSHYLTSIVTPMPKSNRIFRFDSSALSVPVSFSGDSL
jgi:hypothetical protein